MIYIKAILLSILCVILAIILLAGFIGIGLLILPYFNLSNFALFVVSMAILSFMAIGGFIKMTLDFKEHL